MRSGFRVGTGVWGSKAALHKTPPCSLQTPGPQERTLLHGDVSPGVGTCQACNSSRLAGLHPWKEGVSASHPFL